MYRVSRQSPDPREPVDLGVVPNLIRNGPAQVAAWTALARSLGVLLLSLAAVRPGGSARASSTLSMCLGLVGILTTVPAITKIMFMIFGPGMMVWSAWVGINMLRRNAGGTPQPAAP